MKWFTWFDNESSIGDRLRFFRNNFYVFVYSTGVSLCVNFLSLSVARSFSLAPILILRPI